MIKFAAHGNCWRRLNREKSQGDQAARQRHIQMEPNKVTSRNQESRSDPQNETVPAILTEERARYKLSAKSTF